jgi:serine/threonine protein kinase
MRIKVVFSDMTAGAGSMEAVAVVERCGTASFCRRRIGAYDVFETLGRGSYGVVRRARRVADGVVAGDVAIKSMEKCHLRGSQRRRQQLTNEVDAMRVLCKHPHIVGFLECIADNGDTYEHQDDEDGREEGEVHIVMEYAAGGDLLQYIKRRSRLGETEARRLFTELVRALSFAHSQSFVHRDIKLENIFLRADGSSMLGDWGFVGRWTPGQQLDASLGSLHYSAPEIVLGRPYTGPEVDCWSLGVVLYAMVTGRLPFAGSDEYAIGQQILRGSFFLPHFLSADCAVLISSLLQLQPLRRARLLDVQSSAWMSDSADTDSSIGIDSTISDVFEDTCSSQLSAGGQQEPTPSRMVRHMCKPATARCVRPENWHCHTVADSDSGMPSLTSTEMKVDGIDACEPDVDDLEAVLRANEDYGRDGIMLQRPSCDGTTEQSGAADTNEGFGEKLSRVLRRISGLGRLAAHAKAARRQREQRLVTSVVAGAHAPGPAATAPAPAIANDMSAPLALALPPTTTTTKSDRRRPFWRRASYDANPLTAADAAAVVPRLHADTRAHLDATDDPRSPRARGRQLTTVPEEEP